MKDGIRSALYWHKKWLKSGGREGEPANFSFTSLAWFVFPGKTDLTGVSFSQSYLANTNFRRVTGLTLPEAGKAYKLLFSYNKSSSFFVKSLKTGKSFGTNETGLILGIHGTQNESHLDSDKGRSSFDLLFLSGNRKGQIWRGIDWWVLLSYIGEEIKI